jgi:hypothetical protein
MSRISSGDDATVLLDMSSSMVILGSGEGFQGEYLRAQLEWNNPNVDSFHYMYAELGA